MMKQLNQSIDNYKKYAIVGAFALCSVASIAYAQVPSLSLPSLPPLPGAPSAPTAPTASVATTPSTNAIAAPLPAEPVALSDLNPVKTPTAESKKTTNPLADLPPPAPESKDIPTSTADAGTPPPLDLSVPAGLPSLNLTPPTTSEASIPLPVIPNMTMAPPVSLPEVEVASEPKVKSWKTHLASTAINPQTNFNYHRQILPAAISSDRYSRENLHLPRAVMREDYANLLFTSVARNDVEATRALLNTGMPMTIKSDNGETPLMLAQRVGARETAQLLIARGAHL